MNYIIDKDVPHGCLKNGKKPCFRSWKSLKQKPNYHNEILQPIKDDPMIEIKNEIESEINKAVNGEVIHSAELIQKYVKEDRPLQISNDSVLLESFDLNDDFEKEPEYKPIEPLSFPPSVDLPLNEPFQSFDKSLETIDYSSDSLDMEEIENQEPRKIKKTIKRRYTLGKSKNPRGNNYIGVLVRNKYSRKRAMDATKELKKTPSEDIKKYLRDHGLIKVGSSAPTEICRKMYENCKMAGDIENLDKNILLHNLMNDYSDSFEA